MIPGALLMLGAALLVVAGAPKFVGPPVGGLLPAWASRPLGLVELVVGAWALLAPDTGGSWAATATYVALSAVMVVALLRGVPDCGCFGLEPVRPDALHLLVDLVLAAGSAVAAVQQWALPGPWWAATAAVAGALLAGALLVRLLTRPRRGDLGRSDSHPDAP